GAEFLQSINLSGVPLMLTFILITAFINLFIGSASAKWAMMAPIFVPIMMQLGYSPELTQMAYRIADSSTNIISPLMTYFAIIIAFAQKYDKKMGIGTLISTMIPYSIYFLIGWTIILVVWLFFGIELGPGAPMLYRYRLFSEVLLQLTLVVEIYCDVCGVLFSAADRCFPRARLKPPCPGKGYVDVVRKERF